jgi:hypothetical protein
MRLGLRYGKVGSARTALRCLFREPCQEVFEAPVSCVLFVRGSLSCLIHVTSPAQGPLELPGRAQALVLHRAGRGEHANGDRGADNYTSNDEYCHYVGVEC